MKLLLKFVIDRLPPSVNDTKKSWQDNHRKVTAFKNELAALLYAMGVPDLMLGSKDDPLVIEIAYLFGPRARSSDTVSNREKALIDALKHSGVITDDLWIRQGLVLSAEGDTDRTFVKLYRMERPTKEEIVEWYD